MNKGRKFLSSILSVALLSTSMLPSVQAKTTPSLVNWTSLIGDKGGQKSVLFDSVNDVVMSEDKIFAVGLVDGSKITLENGKGDRDASFTILDTDGNQLSQTLTGGSKQDYYYALSEDVNGNFVAVGASKSADGDFHIKNTTNYDAIIAKYDATGKLLKTASFGGSDKEEFNDVTYTYDGGYLAVGYTRSLDGDLAEVIKPNHTRESIAVKYDADLNVEWVATSGVALEESLGVTHEFEAVSLTADGTMVIAGTSTLNTEEMEGLNHGGKDAFLLSLNEDGSKNWIKTYGGSADETGEDFSYVAGLKPGDPGWLVLTGTTESNDGDFVGNNAAGLESAYIMKISLDGEVEWANTLESSEKVNAKSILPTPDGYFMTGMFLMNDGDFAGVNAYGKEDIFVAHYSQEGYLRKIFTFGGNDKDIVEGICYGLNGSYSLYGSSRSSDEEFTNKLGPVDGFITNINAAVAEEYATEKYLVPIQAWKADKDEPSMMSPLLYQDAYVEKTGELYRVTAYFVNANIMGTQVKASSLGAVSYGFEGSMKPAELDEYNPTKQIKVVQVLTRDLSKPIPIHIEDTMGDIRFSFDEDKKQVTEVPPYFEDVEVSQPDFKYESKFNIGGSDVDYANGSAVLSDGKIVVVGQTFSKDQDFKPYKNSASNAFINVYAKDQTLEHTTLLGADYLSTRVYASNVIATKDGGYIVGGCYLDEENKPSGDFADMIQEGSIHGKTDTFIARYTKDHKLVWMQNFSGSQHDQIKYLMAEDDGFVAIIESNSNDGDMDQLNHSGLFDLAFVKYDLNGKQVWKRVIGGRNIETARGGIDVLTNGNYIIAGTTSSGSGDFQGVDYYGDLFDMFAAELDREGNIVWLKTYGGDKNDYCNRVIATKDGGFMLGGHSNSTTGTFDGKGTSYDNAFVMKMSKDGNMEWCDFVKSSDKSEVADIQERDGYYLVLGDTRGMDYDLKGLNKGSRDVFLARYGSDGKRTYFETIGGSSAEYAASLVAVNSYQNGILFYGDSSDGDLKEMNRGEYDGTFVIYNEGKKPAPEVKPAPDKNPTVLENNTIYEVDVDLWNATLDKSSMADAALKQKATIVVKDGKATMHIYTQPMNVGQIKASLEEIRVYELHSDVFKNGKVEAKGNDGKPVEFSFALPHQEKYIRVDVNPHVAVMGNQFIAARIRVNYNTLEKVGVITPEDKPSEKPSTTPDTEVPGTADQSHVIFFGSILLVAGAMVLLTYKRKEQE